ncbi:hypothetical protein TNCV_2556271 [Trichonephila clavipes]|nr:hypothetical protein TNCV_2556271 [Trichonephila clavipes]
MESSFISIIETQAESMPEPDEIDNEIEEVVNLARQTNLEMDNDDIQELLASHNQELTIEELKEMHEQEQDIEKLVFRLSSIRRSNDGWEFNRRPQFD